MNDYLICETVSTIQERDLPYSVCISTRETNPLKEYRFVLYDRDADIELIEVLHVEYETVLSTFSSHFWALVKPTSEVKTK